MSVESKVAEMARRLGVGVEQLSRMTWFEVLALWEARRK
jgi:hypothetical protein